VREKLNSNPLAQVAVIGVLAIVVGFLLLSGMSSGGASEEEATPTAETPVVDDSVEPGVEDAASGAVIPSDPADATAPSEPVPDAAAEAAADGKFVAGPGLPGGVVSAYARGDTPVLMVNRHGGVDDKALRALTRQLQRRRDVALFVTVPKHVSRYSRIAGGVDLDRAPALVVLSPRSVTGDGAPVASVSYGFRGYDSVVQAVRNAGYDGKKLDYHP